MSNREIIYQINHEFPREWSEDGDYVKEYDTEVVSLNRTQAGAWKALREMAADRDVELDRESTSFFHGDDEWYIDTAYLED